MRRGTTFIELVLSLSIIAILSAASYPRVAQLMDGIHVRGTTTEIHALFNAARHQAITRAERITVVVDTAGGSITLVAGSDTIRSRGFADTHGVTLSANRISFTYAPIGIGYGGGNMTMVVRRNRHADSVIVSRLGRVRVN